MMDGREDITQNEFRGARLRILGTNADDPDEGRIFVWTKSGWFERLEGQSGDVAFTPVAKSEAELRELISRDEPSAELVPLDREYRERVTEEFTEQTPSYPDSPQYSEEESSAENDQQYHQHDI